MTTVASTTDSRQNPRRLSLPWLGVTVAVLILCTVAVVFLSQLAMRWQVYFIAATFIGLTMLFADTRKLLVFCFFVFLSINVHYYLTQPLPVLYQGSSSATAFSIPLVLIPGALLLAHQLLLSNLRFRWGREVSYPAALVIVTTLISALFSNVRFFGIIVVFELLQFLLILLITINAVRTPRQAESAIWLLLMTLGLQCLVFFTQTALGVSFTMTGQIVRAAAGDSLIRASGTVGVVPSGFATFVEPLILIAFAIFRTTSSLRQRLFTGVLVALGTIAIVLTLNRSSWVGILIGFATVEIIGRFRQMIRGAWKPLLRLTVVLSAGFLLVFPLISRRLSEDHTGDFETRFNLVKSAVKMIAANPTIGVGPGAYSYNVGSYAPRNSGWLFFVHNEYLLLWAERGTIGFLAWLLWFGAGTKLALSGSRLRSPPFQAFAIGCLSGFVVLAWEFMWNSYEPFSIYALIWCLFGLLLAQKRIVDPDGRSSPPAAVPILA